jgi:hypothetical protein
VAHKKSQSQKYALEISFRLRIKIQPQFGMLLKGAVALLATILAGAAKYFFHAG